MSITYNGCDRMALSHNYRWLTAAHRFARSFCVDSDLSASFDCSRSSASIFFHSTACFLFICFSALAHLEAFEVDTAFVYQAIVSETFG